MSSGTTGSITLALTDRRRDLSPRPRLALDIATSTGAGAADTATSAGSMSSPTAGTTIPALADFLLAPPALAASGMGVGAGTAATTCGSVHDNGASMFAAASSGVIPVVPPDDEGLRSSWYGPADSFLSMRTECRRWTRGGSAATALIALILSFTLPCGINFTELRSPGMPENASSVEQRKANEPALPCVLSSFSEPRSTHPTRGRER